MYKRHQVKVALALGPALARACILGVALLSLLRAAHGLDSMRMRRVGVENFTDDGHALKILGVRNDRPFHPSDAMSFLPDDRQPLIEPNACTGSGWIIPIGMPTIGVMPIAIVGVGGCT